MCAALPRGRRARVFFGFHDGMLIALHAIVKKTQKTPAEELVLAKQKLKQVQSWHAKTRTSGQVSRAGSVKLESARRLPPPLKL